ncbi:MAG: hypothetical protein JO022_15915, partial [Acidobacteriaceae bacterium]|nr:hypothetical protein [Acidobacteriaceae bacterium]
MAGLAITLVSGVLLALYLDWNFVELGLVLGLAAARSRLHAPWFDRIEQFGVQVARRRGVCIVAAFVLPILIRVALLPWDPVPQPWLPDEFSHLLVADTLVHRRLANPSHPLWVNFETIHEIFKPTYASIYFPGLGLVLAVGTLLGHAWIGVLLSSGAMCAALLWMLYGFFPPRWALLGGMLAVLRWGALSYWVNSYWGGTIGALAGALVFGAYARLRKRPSISHSTVLGLGLVLLAYTRPLEGFMVGASVMAALLWSWRTRPSAELVRAAVPAFVLIGLGLAVLGMYFQAITGSPFHMPYRVNQELYGWPLTLPWDHPKLVSYRNPDLAAYYEWERCTQLRKTWPVEALKFSTFTLGPLWRFFVGPALTVPLLLGGRWYRSPKIRLLVICLVISCVVGFVIAAYPHYVAPAAGCCLAAVVQGLRYLRLRSVAWTRAVLATCCLMVPLRAFVDSRHLPHTLPGYHSWSALGHDQGQHRAGLVKRLLQTP